MFVIIHIQRASIITEIPQTTAAYDETDVHAQEHQPAARHACDSPSFSGIRYDTRCYDKI